MKIWLDAHCHLRWRRGSVPNSGCLWLPVRDLGYREAKDREIFIAARQAGAVVMTKDKDFVRLVEELGSPPQVIWLACGNTSNTRLKEILKQTFGKTIELTCGIAHGGHDGAAL